MTTISVTRALSELKSLDDRIGKALNSSQFIAFKVDSKVVGVNSSHDVSVVEASIKANLQSVKDLVARRDTLKTAVVKSNAETSVTVGTTVMTVAQAIERKNSIHYQEALLGALRSQFVNAKSKIEQQNSVMETKIHALLEQNFGKDRKANDEEADAIVKPYKQRHEASIVDPLNVLNVVENLSKEIEEFNLNVDFSLSEINATTQIVVA